MILFYNVFITNQRASASGLNRVDRLDLFKYSLASYACIDRITEVIVYCQLDNDYKEREPELTRYIWSLFPAAKVSYHRWSPSNQIEWQKALLENRATLVEGDQPIIYMGNDDHIFIDFDLDVLYEGLDLMAAQPQDQINTIPISSWPEAISTVYGLGAFKTIGRYWETDLLYSDACQIVNSTFFRHVFFDLQMGDGYRRRTDGFIDGWYPLMGDYAYSSFVPHPAVKAFIPLREQVRHFDAYFHVGMSATECPMLDIPVGFWDGTIKADPWSSPLFWRSRISEAGPRLDTNAAHRRVMTAVHSRGFQDPRYYKKDVPTYRAFSWKEPLPLEERYIQLGCR